MLLATHDQQCAASLALTTTVARLAQISARADEFIHANAPHWLKCQRQKLIDLGVVSLIEFENDIFTWDYLRLIFLERLGVYENGSLPWYIDIDRSTDRILTVRHENGTQLQFDLGQLLLSALRNVH